MNVPHRPRIYFFPNGTTAVTDEQGQQVAELQTPWFKLAVEHLREQGIDPTTATFRMPNGDYAILHAGDGWTVSSLKPEVPKRPL